VRECGGKQKQRGVTLLELLIVMTLIALMAGVSYPSVSSGIDSLRLRSAADSVATFLNTAIDRAQRREQVVEVWISPRDNAMIARSPDQQFLRRLDVPDSIHISAVLPAEINGNEPRRFLMYPGGTIPRIAVELANANGRKRLVAVDPMTGIPHSQSENQ